MTRGARLKQKLLDGRYRCGYVSRRTGRYGTESIRVVIYPPDTTQTERRYARLARLWPGISVGLLISKAPAVAALTDTPVLVTAALVVLVLILLGDALTRVSAPVVDRSVQLFASVSLLSPRETDRHRYDYAAHTAENLHATEQYLDRGHIPWNRYHLLWEETYWNACRWA